MIKLAIQGVKGCFHEIAAYKYFGERQQIEAVECHSFEEMFRQFKEDNNLYGVMAIENTVAGSIIPNYAKLRQSEMRIIGEVYLRIEQHLLAKSEVSLAEINEVRSHPMAILQCLNFFEDYPQIKLTESPDTALSAKLLSESDEKNVGVIASSLAASTYNLEILKNNIETNRRNFTRFLILQNKNLSKDQSDQAEHTNKASICFTVGHTPGSLGNVLRIFSENQINLTKIQSMPVIGKEWEYLFLIDLEYAQKEEYIKAMELSKELMTELQILGEYQKGIKFRTL